jgi:hypothetical protein
VGRRDLKRSPRRSDVSAFRGGSGSPALTTLFDEGCAENGREPSPRDPCFGAPERPAAGHDAAPWRSRALEWLSADLAARTGSDPDLAATLEHWKSDPDLAGVRDRLADLPEEERKGWSSLWADVDATLARARQRR